MTNALVGIQTATFFMLGVTFWFDGAQRLGTAQLLLGVITLLVYA